jgi:hypothetical protein
MNPDTLLLLNLALAFYAVGTIWAHEVDIFRSWRLVDPDTFRRLQLAHWRKLPYWVFVPIGLMFVGSTTLVWYHPIASPGWAVWGSVTSQLASHGLTAAMWGPWQAKLSTDDRGSGSPYLAKILSTHWIRTVLMTANGVIVLAWAMRVFA